jgi:pectin methylesterase-like acyl-CoA thioesterase
VSKGQGGTLVIAGRRNGSEDFRTVQRAVVSASCHHEKSVVIFVRNGRY